ncbi:2-C-methyl-D-erythritol 4-phosphate cytidylyltransferase [Luteimicrobium sp. DT211]|uniref:2-C-methyl-D-erythritol 4-phosphate cytidylyltransferase n=1 Tax=Luteimicrobium sp. DT211 TaxID=3393412 RepID=UPI003CF00F13
MRGPAFAAVLTAAGSGTRLGADVPKALVPLDGAPLVVHAASRLVDAGATVVVITAPAGHVDHVRAALDGTRGLGAPRVVVVPGGPTRQASVAAGLAGLPSAAGPIVLVHDAARALAPTALLVRVAQTVREGHDAVVPVLPVTDTVVRFVPSADGGPARSGGTVDRRGLRAVQTPQGFRRHVLERAHAAGAGVAADEATAASDDASLVAALGVDVALVDGDARALKITTAHDLAVATLLLTEGA